MANAVYEKLLKCKEAVRKVTDFEPDVALVLGSGLGGFAENIKIETEIPYSDIPGFPVSTVPDMQESLFSDISETRKLSA